MRKGPENTKPIFSRSDHTEAKQYILIDQELRAQISNPKSQLWKKGGLENKEYVYPATPAPPSPKGELGRIHHLEPISFWPHHKGHIQMQKLVKRVSHLGSFAYICIPTQECIVHS